MSIPIPSLDDRRFQDLVDDAKRRIADRCPEWTDHNVSDPGITLIELFAQMVDETLFRLNRVPEKMQVLLMNMIGMRLQPGTAAEAPLTFWLTAPTRFWSESDENSPRLAGPGVEVSTERQPGMPPVSFRTTEPALLQRAVVRSRYAGSADSDDEPGPERSGRESFAVFGSQPTPGKAFFVLLERPVPGCAVKVSLDCEANQGSGVQPPDPPWEWQAWCRDGWRRCDLDRDTTGGLNRDGSVYLHVPREHTAQAFASTPSGGWLRCVLVPPRRGQPFYERSPVIRAVSAETLGVSVASAQADVLVRDEVVGVSEGTYGQPPFQLRNVPLVADDSGGPRLLAGDDETPWVPVDSLEGSDEQDRHYLLDRVAGTIRLGLAVRQADGRVRRYAAVPPAGAPLRVAEYRVGGGLHGNVRAGSLRIMKAPLPNVRRVENRSAAVGGTDPETVEQAMLRAPIFLRRRTRAVTLGDFAALAREATPSVTRTHAIAGSESGGDPLSVRVVVLPSVSATAGLTSPLTRADLTPSPEAMISVARYLDERRMVGIRVHIEAPACVPVTVRATLAAPWAVDRRALQESALAAVYRLLHPLVGGEDGEGWPFGSDVRVGDVYAALTRVLGQAHIAAVTLLDADGADTDRVAVPSNGLPLSAQHSVEIAEPDVAGIT